MDEIFLQGCPILAASCKGFLRATVAHWLQVTNQSIVATNVYMNIHPWPCFSSVVAGSDCKATIYYSPKTHFSGSKTWGCPWCPLPQENVYINMHVHNLQQHKEQKDIMQIPSPTPFSKGNWVHNHRGSNRCNIPLEMGPSETDREHLCAILTSQAVRGVPGGLLWMDCLEGSCHTLRLKRLALHPNQIFTAAFSPCPGELRT